MQTTFSGSLCVQSRGSADSVSLCFCSTGGRRRSCCRRTTGPSSGTSWGAIAGRSRSRDDPYSPLLLTKCFGRESPGSACSYVEH